MLTKTRTPGTGGDRPGAKGKTTRPQDITSPGATQARRITIDDLLARLDAVRKSGPGWQARCPAHDDRSPSLSIREGDRGVLLKCWSGCALSEIVGALGIEVSDLFFDALDTRPQVRHEAVRRREIERTRREADRIAALRECAALEAAERTIESLTGLDVSTWTDEELDRAMDLAADAHALLMGEERRQWMQ